MPRHFAVVIVGAGPAGLSLAIECLELGIRRDKIMVLEKGEVPIDAIRKFYPDKKMTLANYKGLPTETHGHLSVFPDLTKAQTLDYFNDLIKKYEIPIQYNSEVSKVTQEGGQFKILAGHEIFTAEFVAIGIGILGRPNKPDYKIPNSLKQNVLFDITSQKLTGQNILVVGGGDTSSEYCQVLVLDQNKVTMAYRKEKFSRMMETNSTALEKLTAERKVSVRLNCSIKEIQDEGGKPKVIFENEKEFAPEVFDKVVYAIGGSTPLNFLRTASVECPNDWPKYGSSGETNVPGLYLVGDLVAGKLGGSIITAYNSSFRTAQSILEKMKASA